MRYLPRIVNLPNECILDDSASDIVKHITDIKFKYKGKAFPVSFMEILVSIFCTEYPLTTLTSCYRLSTSPNVNISDLAGKILGEKSFPYSILDIFAMVCCGYTVDEVKKGICEEYRDELVNLKEIKDVHSQRDIGAVSIVSNNCIYTYPLKLVVEYRPELLYSDVCDTDYLSENNLYGSMKLMKLQIHREYVPHKVTCIKRKKEEHIDFKNYSDFVLKTRVSDKDKNRGWFTIECHVRSYETRKSCSEHIKDIDKSAIREAEKLLQKWNMPLGCFEVSRKWFVNGSVLYRFDLKKELEKCLK